MFGLTSNLYEKKKAETEPFAFEEEKDYVVFGEV